MPSSGRSHSAMDPNINLKRLSGVDIGDNHLRPSKKSTMLHSRTIALVDLRLTRPPEALRRKHQAAVVEEHSSHEISVTDVPMSPERTRRSTPERRKREKLEELGEMEQQIKGSPKNKDLFADLDPAARKRLHAMLSNFMSDGEGKFKSEISLHKFALDSNEIVSNGTVQEICVIHPDLESLDLTNCVHISDAGMWAIARHCAQIKTLILAGCSNITNIGLRSVSLRCSEIVYLDLSYCSKLDDLGLATVAGGCWKLEVLLLRKCPGITDTGIGRLARACWRLKVLELSGCQGIGEYGDHALMEIGAFCTDMRVLDMTGCRRAQDKGIRAIAAGCPHIQRLRLSGCDSVSGVGLRALAKHCRGLSDLALTDCVRLCDADLESLHSDAMTNSLTALDLSGCQRVTDRGISSLLSGIGGKLFTLSLSDSCATDASTKAIVKICSKLRSLDLSHCKAITDITVSLVAENVTGLTTLKLDGNSHVTTRTVTKYLGHVVGGAGSEQGSGSGQGPCFPLRFAELARDWLGYQPRLHHEEMIAATELHRSRMEAALTIQCALRRKFAYNKYRFHRRMWLVNDVIPRVQARVRGMIQRRKYAVMQLEVLRHRMATKLQACYRRFIAVRDFDRQLKAIRKRALHTIKALLIQSTYRRLLARRIAQDRRNERANVRLQEAKKTTNRQLSAIRIQCAVRMLLARREVSRRMAVRDELIALTRLRTRMSIVIERVTRGMWGRAAARRRRAEIALYWRCWRMARHIQRCYRGHKCRRRVKSLREALWLQLQNKAATDIERAWRGRRDRVLTSLLRGLRDLRIKRIKGACTIQRNFRGWQARRRVERIQKELLVSRRRLVAACTLQRVYRGHKGKEAAEIERRLLEMESLAKPLLDLLATLEVEAGRLAAKVKHLEEVEEHLSSEVEAIERERLYADNTTSMWTDSTRVNGIPQRFLTKFLRVRLVDILKNTEMDWHKKRKELLFTNTALKDVNRRVRGTQRELVPLTTGLVVKVRTERSKRLRLKVRTEKRAAVMIQAKWRGALTRLAYHDPARDCWIQCVDEDQGNSKYYYNTWTQQTVWKPPLAFRLFGQHDTST
eukprot:gene2654-5210_t